MRPNELETLLRKLALVKRMVPNRILQNGRPVVKAANIQKRVGFHTFPHTHTTLLDSEQRGSEGGTGAPTSCEQSHYAGSLRSGGYAKQEAGTKQTCSDGSQQGEKHWPNWTKLDHDRKCQFLASA